MEERKIERKRKEGGKEITNRTTRSQKCLIALCGTTNWQKFFGLHMIIANYFNASEPTVADLQVKLSSMCKHVKF